MTRTRLLSEAVSYDAGYAKPWSSRIGEGRVALSEKSQASLGKNKGVSSRLSIISFKCSTSKSFARPAVIRSQTSIDTALNTRSRISQRSIPVQSSPTSTSKPTPIRFNKPSTLSAELSFSKTPIKAPSYTESPAVSSSFLSTAKTQSPRTRVTSNPKLRPQAPASRTMTLPARLAGPKARQLSSARLSTYSAVSVNPSKAERSQASSRPAAETAGRTARTGVHAKHVTSKKSASSLISTRPISLTGPGSRARATNATAAAAVPKQTQNPIRLGAENVKRISATSGTSTSRLKSFATISGAPKRSLRPPPEPSYSNRSPALGCNVASTPSQTRRTSRTPGGNELGPALDARGTSNVRSPKSPEPKGARPLSRFSLAKASSSPILTPRSTPARNNVPVTMGTSSRISLSLVSNFTKPKRPTRPPPPAPIITVTPSVAPTPSPGTTRPIPTRSKSAPVPPKSPYFGSTGTQSASVTGASPTTRPQVKRSITIPALKISALNSRLISTDSTPHTALSFAAVYYPEEGLSGYLGSNILEFASQKTPTPFSHPPLPAFQAADNSLIEASDISITSQNPRISEVPKAEYDFSIPSTPYFPPPDELPSTLPRPRARRNSATALPNSRHARLFSSFGIACESENPPSLSQCRDSDISTHRCTFMDFLAKSNSGSSSTESPSSTGSPVTPSLSSPPSPIVFSHPVQSYGAESYLVDFGLDLETDHTLCQGSELGRVSRRRVSEPTRTSFSDEGFYEASWYDLLLDPKRKIETELSHALDPMVDEEFLMPSRFSVSTTSTSNYIELCSQDLQSTPLLPQTAPWSKINTLTLKAVEAEAFSSSLQESKAYHLPLLNFDDHFLPIPISMQSRKAATGSVPRYAPKEQRLIIKKPAPPDSADMKQRQRRPEIRRGVKDVIQEKVGHSKMNKRQFEHGWVWVQVRR